MLALRELLHNLKDRDWDVNPTYKIDENEAKRIIEGIEEVNKWILCSERLPEEREWYLAVFKEIDTGFQLNQSHIKQKVRAMMQIVINIPEQLYKECQSFILTKATEGLPFHVIKTIANGTVLPRHGRLIDADVLKQKIGDSTVKQEASKIFAENIIRFAPTIIEADRGVENDKDRIEHILAEYGVYQSAGFVENKAGEEE